MTIEHRNIPDSQLHEPKGASSASYGDVYVSDGAGSGVWRRVGSDVLSGLAGDSGSTNSKLVTDGVNGFVLRRDASYGVMAITDNTNGFSVSAAADSTFQTPSDFVLFTGTGAPWASENLFGGISFDTNRLIVPVNGMYRVDLWGSISSFPTNTARIGVKYRINGGAFSARTTIAKSDSNNDFGSLDGFGLVNLSAGDYVQLYVVSTHTGNLTFVHLNTTLTLVRQI